MASTRSYALALQVFVALGLGACANTHDGAGGKANADASAPLDASVQPDAKPSDAAAALSCDDLAKVAADKVAWAVQTTDKTCTTVADCVLVPKQTSCTDSCSDAIAASGGKQRLLAALHEIEAGACASFAASGCKRLALPCVPQTPTPFLACFKGQCVVTQQDPGNCPTGCTANPQTGLCDGSSSCSGCPAHPEQPPTSCKSSVLCSYSPACGGYQCTCDENSHLWSCAARAC